MAKKDKQHWGEIASSLEENVEMPPVEETDAKTEAKPTKSRAKTPTARKRTAKKEKADAPLEKTLLDSFETDETQLDLTVGAEKPSEKKARRTKKADEKFVERAIAAEDKRARETRNAKNKKIAEAIVEKAKEPFVKIAGQIEQRISDLSEGESAEPDEKPVKKRRAARPKKAAEPDEKPDAKPTAGEFDWDTDETLDVSWGRPPKRSAPVGEPKEAPAREEISDFFDEPIPKKKAPVEKESKITREEAEKKFASLFGSADAGNEDAVEPAEPVRAATVDDNDFWGIPDEPEIGFSSRKKKPEPKPEPKKTEPPRAERPRREERAPREERPRREERAPREERPRREERAPREERPRREERAPREERPRREERAPREERPRREERAPREERPRREERAPREERPRHGDRSRWSEISPSEDFVSEEEHFWQEERAPQEERGGRPRRERRDRDERGMWDESADDVRDRRQGERDEPRERDEKLFPTWRDAIDGIVHKNISRHGGSPKGGGDRRRR